MLWNGWTRFWQIVGRELKLEIQSLRVEGDQYAILEWAQQPHACEMRTASGYDQEDSSSSPEPRFEKDLCSASSFHYGVRVCGLERRQHFNSSEATGPFLPRKSCPASTGASKIQLPDFVAILQDKKQALAYVPATLTASSLQYVVTTIICAVIIFQYQQWGRPVHWRPFFQDPSFCGMTCPQTSRHWELLRRLKLLLSNI